MFDGRASAGVNLTWIDRWLLWRNRLLANAEFQRRAAASLLTRPFAQRSARRAFDLVAGFVYSQVLLSCVRLKVFELLLEKPHDVTQIAQTTGLSKDATERLVLAAVALQLLQPCSGDRYTLGVLGAPLARNAGVLAMVEHHQDFYLDLADPVALLRSVGSRNFSTRISSLWAYAKPNAAQAMQSEKVAQYCALMTTSQTLVASEILDAYPLHGHRCLLDIGGGEGAFLKKAAERAPHMRWMLFDLPAVIARAVDSLGEGAITGRVCTFAGNFLKDTLPKGADIVTLVRVVHDHDDVDVVKLFKAIRSALPDAGTLLIAEPMAETSGANAMGAAYFGFYLMAMGQGRSRTSAQLMELLNASGFSRVRSVSTRMPLQVSLLVAQP